MFASSGLQTGKHRLAEQQAAAGHAALGHVAHREIDARALEVVDHLVGRRDAHVDVRVVAREAREVRDQPQRREPRRRRDDDGVQCPRAAHAARAFVQFLERVLRRSIEQLPAFGQQQRARAPLEQLHLEVLLELLNLPADGRLGQEQLGGRLREGQVAGRGLERQQRVERRHVVALVTHAKNASIGCGKTVCSRCSLRRIMPAVKQESDKANSVADAYRKFMK